jgi:8-oxo-dGTP pyrophosphatase MutT (NUDIX family)
MEEKHVDIQKAGGILLKDRHFLVSRSKGKDFFVAPGGRVEEGEETEDALIRELREELCITVSPDDIAPFGTFYAQAAGEIDQRLQMDVFMVTRWEGDIVAANEVEELIWINSSPPAGMTLGSIFEKEVLPMLRAQNLID